MPALIIVDQATRPAGVAGKARSDGVVSQLVTCTNDTVEASYLWTLVDVPIRSALTRGTTGTAASFTFTPDVKGTYLVTLRVNASAADVDNAKTHLAIRTSGGKTLAWRYQGGGETTEDNEDYVGLGFPGDTNPRAWATNEDLIYEEVEEGIWETQNAITTFGGLIQRIVMTDPATGKVHPSLIAGTAPTGPAGGDLTGTYPNPTVVALRGRSIVTPFNPTDGQTIWWVTASNEFQLSSDILTQAAGALVGLQPGTEPAPSLFFKTDTDTGFYRAGANRLAATAGGSLCVEFTNSQLQAQPLSAAQPSYSFLGDINTGIYNPTNDEFGIATNGTERLVITNTLARFAGVLTSANGSSGAPAYSFTADPDTGMYRSAADTLDFVTNATKQLEIGTVSVHAYLPLIAPNISVDDGTAASPAYSFTSESTLGMYRFGAGQLGWSSAGVLRVLMSTAALSAGSTNAMDLGAAGLRWKDVYAHRALLQDGTAGAPSHSFESEPATGLYRSVANTLAVSLGGIQSHAFQGGTLYFQLINGGISAGAVDGFLKVEGVISGGSAEAVRLSNLLNYVGGAGVSQKAVAVRSIINQTSTAAFTDLMLVRTETAVGSGTQRFIEASVAAGATVRAYLTNTGEWAVGNGAVTAPSYSFTGDSNTGLWRVGSGINAFAGDGLEICRIQAPSGANPQILWADGSTTLPGLAINGDPDTGLFAAGLNMLGISTGGDWIAKLQQAAVAATGNEIGANFEVEVNKATSGDYTGFYFNIADTASPDELTVYDWRVDGTTVSLLNQLHLLVPTGFNSSSPGLASTYDSTWGIDWYAGVDGTVMRMAYCQVEDTHLAFEPSGDNTITLGMAANRWADVFAVQTTIGDLTLKDPYGGAAHWKIIEGEDEIFAYNIRTGRKYAIAMIPLENTDADVEKMSKERERFAGVAHGQ